MPFDHFTLSSEKKKRFQLRTQSVKYEFGFNRMFEVLQIYRTSSAFSQISEEGQAIRLIEIH